MIKKGENKLESAEILLNNNQFDDSISRSYYAVFLICKALLLLLGSTPKTHSGMITMIGLKVINEGILPVKIGRDISRLLEARQNSDYAIYSFYEKEDAENLLLKAKDVVSKIKDVLKDRFNIELDL